MDGGKRRRAGNERPPFKWATALAVLQRAAVSRGIVLVLRGEGTGELPPTATQFLEVVRCARTETADETHALAHVERLVAAIVTGLSLGDGPLRLNRTAWLLLKSYAETGAVPQTAREIQAAFETGPAARPSRNAKGCHNDRRAQ